MLPAIQASLFIWRYILKKFLSLAITMVFALNQVTYASNFRTNTHSKMMKNLVAAQVKAKVSSMSTSEQKEFLENSVSELDKAARTIEATSDSDFQKAKAEGIKNIEKEDSHKAAQAIRAKMSMEQVQIAESSLDPELALAIDGDPVTAAIQSEAVKYKQNAITMLKSLDRTSLLENIKATKEKAKETQEELRANYNLVKIVSTVFMILALVAMLMIFVGLIGWAIGAASADAAFASTATWLAVGSAICTGIFLGVWIGTLVVKNKINNQLPRAFTPPPGVAYITSTPITEPTPENPKGETATEFEVDLTGDRS